MLPWQVLIVAVALFGRLSDADSTTTVSTTTPTTTTSTTTTTTTTVTTPTTPTSAFPCIDSLSNCQSSIQKDQTYCNKGTQNYATARSSCCFSCCMHLGFTAVKPQKQVKNGVVVTVNVNVVDLTGTAAMTWSALQTVNSGYPGLNDAKTSQLCLQRSTQYGAARFCADPYARTVCGETCKPYNYPSG